MADLMTRPRRYLAKEEVRAGSSFYDIETVYSRMFSVTDADPTAADPINRAEWLDPLDDRVHRALDRTRSMCPHTYLGEPITTVAFQYWQLTSPWWLIVIFNGYLHPDEIPSGQEIEIPDLGGFLEHYRAQVRKAQRTIVF